MDKMKELVKKHLGELLLNNVVGEFLKDLYTLAKGAAVGVYNLRENAEKLRSTVERIKATLNDAEERRVIKDNAVLQRLRDLRVIVLDAEDVLEEFRASEEAVRVPGTRKRKRFVYPFDLASRVEDIQQRYMNIHTDSEQMKRILSKSEVRPTLTWTKDTRPSAEDSSLHDPSRFHGRTDEMRMLIDALKLGGDTKLAVISIEGIGGIGKTELARAVYAIRDEKLKFDCRVWIDVSDGEFDVHSITRKIIESVSKNRECRLTTLNSLHERLQKLLSGKRFLLVLNNVARVAFDQFDKLRLPLIRNEKGSRILVTTRNADVSREVRASPKIHLKNLDEESCWELFKDRAFMGREPSQRLERCGKRIVSSCGGSPLLVKTIGSLLYGVDDEKEWDEFTGFVLRVDANNVLLALKVSYEQLPSRLRRCFEFCSIFPKGHAFDKDELVRLWMALGLVETENSNNQIQLERRGRKYFDELFWNSFFHIVDDNGSDHKEYQMPSLIHELAQMVSAHECFGIDGTYVHGDAEKSRYAFYKNPETFEKIGEHQCLRALVLRGQDKDRTNLEKILCGSRSKMRFLRVLDLSCNQLKELQDWIVELTLLRYLALRGSRIERLPQSIGGLLMLETLELSGCDQLRQLPDSIGNLKRMKYLGLRQTGMTSLPDSLCSVTSLQKLDLGDCRGCWRLPNDIGNLVALTHLKLNHTCIKRLPESVSKLAKLSVLDLSDCYELEELPEGLSGLTNLRHLDLHLDWEKWDRKKDLRSVPPGIGQLRFLQVLSRFPVGKEEGRGIGQLKDLLVEGELCISKLENVAEIEVESANIAAKDRIKLLILQWSSCASVCKVDPQQVITKLRPSANVKHLWIENYSGAGFPPWISNRSFENLETLRLLDCKSCRRFPPLGQLPALKSLHIKGLDGIDKLEVRHVRSRGRHQMFSSLRTFQVSHMSALSRMLISGMAKLLELSITDCPKLKEVSHLPRSLKRFELRNCESLHVFKQSSLRDLRDLTVEKCSPAILRWIQELTSLSSLTLSQLEVDALGSESFGGLRTLVMSRMPTLCNVDMSGMGNLLELSVSDCPNLKEVSHLPSTLERFELRNCKSLHVFQQLPSTSLQDLTVEKCSTEIFRWIEGLTSLSSLTVSQVELVELGSESFRGLEGLKSLKIESCDRLKTLSANNWLQRLTSLECLEISSCPEFSFSDGNSLPAALKELRLKSCKKLKDPPKLPTGLRHLTVRDCPGVRGNGVPFYGFWKKSEWDQIKDIEEMDID